MLPHVLDLSLHREHEERDKVEQEDGPECIDHYRERLYHEEHEATVHGITRDRIEPLGRKPIDGSEQGAGARLAEFGACLTEHNK